jgi:predicted peroxiredoxin
MHIPKDKEDKTMTTNKYFEEIYTKSCEYTKEKRAREEEKDQIIENNGWDSEELKAWKARQESFNYPYTAGQVKAYRAWEHSTENNLDTIELNDFLWEKEVEDFARTLKEAGISEFIYTCTSTALMDNIHDLEANGWKMTGLTEFAKKNHWGDEEITRGLRFEAR